FNFDVLVGDGGQLIGVGVGILQRNEFSRRRLVILVVRGGRALRRARKRRSLENRAAFRAGNRIFVKIEKSRAAILTLTLIAEFWFCHGPTSRRDGDSGGRRRNFWSG